MKASLQTSDQKDIQINYLQQQLLSTRQVVFSFNTFYLINELYLFLFTNN